MITCRPFNKRSPKTRTRMNVLLPVLVLVLGARSMGRLAGHLAFAWIVLPGDAEAHDWYEGKSDPVLHYDCCGIADCRPVKSDDVRMTKDGYFVRTPRPGFLNQPHEAEWFIPRDRVQAAPDDQYHICERLMPHHRTIVPHLKYETYHRMTLTCFFAPMGTGSIKSTKSDFNHIRD